MKHLIVKYKSLSNSRLTEFSSAMQRWGKLAKAPKGDRTAPVGSLRVEGCKSAYAFSVSFVAEQRRFIVRLCSEQVSITNVESSYHDPC